MNFELPFGFNFTLGINCFNLVLGLITFEDFQMVSALVGLTTNLIYFLVKMYKLIDSKTQPTDYEPTALTRQCANCRKAFETKTPDQIFCGEACKTTFYTDAYIRK